MAVAVCVHACAGGSREAESAKPPTETFSLPLGEPVDRLAQKVAKLADVPGAFDAAEVTNKPADAASLDGGAQPKPVRGGLSRDVINRVITRHYPEAKYCYDLALMNRVDTEGKVELRFLIGSSGAVIASVIDSSTVNQPLLAECIRRTAGRWIFPAPQGGGTVRVSYPYVFKTGFGSDGGS